MPDKEVRKLAAVMFTDIEGYSALVQQDEGDAMKKVFSHRHFLELYTAQNNGKVIQFYGDGSLSIYDSAVDAVYCAIDMQKAYRAENPVPVRIGIHVGDIVFKDETVFGDGVNIASRIQATGIPGSVLLSHRVQSELANHPDIHTKSLGQAKLKNISSPIEIFAVTNDGLPVPKIVKKLPGLNQIVRYLPFILLAGIAFWFIQQELHGQLKESNYKEETISIPVFTNYTGDASMDQIGQMASHWITKELSSAPNAHVVSYESASEMIKMADMSLTSKRGRDNYASLTGAANIVDASYYLYGKNSDSLVMIGFFRRLKSYDVIIALKDVYCSSTNPMECIKAMASQIKGNWVSRDDLMLTPPNYDAYKAYLAARSAWRTQKKKFVFEQLNNAIALDPTFLDPYFLMLDFFYNEGNNQAAYDTIESIRRKFPVLDKRQRNMLDYHTADVEGRNEEAYHYFMNEYLIDSLDLFINNSAMVLALMYKRTPAKALEFFNAIPNDSLHVEGCSYCTERLELAMWAALDLDNMKLADQLAPKINGALYARQSYGMLVMYYVWKKDTAKLDNILMAAQQNTGLDRDWKYLCYLAGRLFLLRGEKTLSSLYAQKAITIYQSGPTKNARMLGRSYYLDNQLDKALKNYKIAVTKEPKNAMFLSELGMIYARKGDTIEVHKIMDKLESLRTRFDYGAIEYYEGRLYALMGDLEKATTLLETSLQKGRKFEIWVTFTHDPDLSALQNFPKYKELLLR